MYVRDFYFLFLCVRRLGRDKVTHILYIHIVDDTHARWQCFPRTNLLRSSQKLPVFPSVMQHFTLQI